MRADSPSIFRKFLGLKVSHEETAADACGNPLQMQQLCCGKRPPGFSEIGIRRFSNLMCNSLGMAAANHQLGKSATRRIWLM